MLLTSRGFPRTGRKNLRHNGPGTVAGTSLVRAGSVAMLRLPRGLIGLAWHVPRPWSEVKMGQKDTVSIVVVGILILGFAMDGGLRAQPDRKSREWTYKGEVFAGIGVSRFYHGNNHLGNGTDWTAGFGVRPFTGALRGLGFQVSASGFNFNREWSDGYSNQGNVLAVTADALYHFGKSSTQFYLMGGAGTFRADYQSINPYTRELLNNPSYVEKHKATQLAISLGAGVKARITSKLSIRPEIRFLNTAAGSGHNWENLLLSIGVGYHF